MRIQGVSSSPCWEYHVFLSFRGEDTRKKFTDHLYTALKSAGINVFRDDKELKRGKEISTELLETIEKSRFSIVVFSRNYASSTWCLDELVKIVECMKTRGQTVLPIFYDVDPSILQNQGENFQEAFVKDEEVRENTEKVEKWKTALRVVANLSGWDAKDRYESELVKEIVEQISCTLNFSKHRKNITDIVGLDSRLKKLKMIIGAGSDDVRMIGICGMGGIGKTTIATAIFESISSEFEGSSFVANVRENSVKHDLIYLQKNLLSQILIGININIYTASDGISMIIDRLQCRKVLIVLDDVDHAKQLNNLADKCEWFGSGSRIIITTRDEHLLKIHGVHETYMVEKLGDDEAYQLFSLKAFKKYQPPEDFLDLSKRVVQYASGLPLALKVLGRHLCSRNIDEWRSALDRLGKDPENEILDILQISFDGLKESDKKIFLDIACFFKGKRQDYVKNILDGCDFNYDIGIINLIDKCLITLSENKILSMHDLLQEMGYQIVIRESPKEPGNRSRLWKEADIKHVLTKNTGTEAVEGIMSEKNLNLSISAKAFSKMANLRLLKIYKVQLPEGLDNLSDELRLLIWHGYPLKSLPSSFQPVRVVDLELCCSPIEQLWKRSTHLNMLTSIRLRDCRNLNEIPNLTWAPNLVSLFIAGCPSLHGIHSPLLVLKKLKSLEVRDCASLMTLPGKIHMENLKSFLLFGCPKLKNFPEIAGRMENLKSLYFSGTAVREMPSSIELLIGLEDLYLSDNNSLVTLPCAISNLKSLVLLSLSNCSNLKSLPDTINGLTCLEVLYLSGWSNLLTLPETINGLTSVQYLNLSDCSNLVSLPSAINGLTSLQDLNLSGCSNLVTLPDINNLAFLRNLNLSGCSNLERLPSTINGLASLQGLNLSGCSNLMTLPDTINGLISLKYLNLSGCSNLVTLPDSIYSLASLCNLNLSGCSNLLILSSTINRFIFIIELDLSDCDLGEIPSSFFPGLFSLEMLDLSRNNFLSLPLTIRDLPNLKNLLLRDCKNLQSVPELPSGIQVLSLDGCDSFKTLTAFKSFNSLYSSISCINCLKLFVDDDFILSVVKALLKVQLERSSGEAVFPGDYIPNWVRHKIEGSSISIKWPPDLYNNKLVGFIFCSVFRGGNTVLGDSAWLQCHVTTEEEDLDVSPWSQMDNYLIQSKSKHIGLFYLPRHWYFKQDKYILIKLSFQREEMFQVNGRFEREGGGGEVERCGIHPIYEQDLTDFNPTANQPIVNVATTYGSLLDPDDEEPQPKRFKKSSS